MQPGDKIVIPQDDLYVFTWETSFGDFQSDHRSETHNQQNERAEINSDAAETVEQPDQILTDVDLRSTGRDAMEEILPNPMMHLNDDAVNPDDKTSSGGGDTIVVRSIRKRK